ncbi:GIY-YIG nuclease family protein [Corynebacterium heidelbergense]|uniref:Bacteriophage T5 Orf172 DNA-binding domain-containing protein n=1 Tax=Corynebacterium heidelbergense TaxID=2055947 RepID=A0A364V6F1_9CORY|nr:GIY-YIG nuclease family protein [Corynebacterium heidelbergense]RAV32222.1 hypothetical protein DLJ54_04295 [Corynebacterium heidelbergense]
MTEELSPELLAILDDDDEGIFDEPVKPRKLTSDDRLERAFLEILEFVDTHKREPDPDTRVISERKLGARLVGIRGSETKRKALAHLDDHGLLEEADPPASLDELLDEADSGDDILADILGDDDENDLYDVSSLPGASRKAPESVAMREKAKDFARFEPLFKQKQKELKDGTRILADFAGESTIAPGKFYLLKGSLVFVAEVYDPEPEAPLDTTGKPKRRLRVIFENGTESSMFVKSLAIRLYEENGKVLARAGQIDASEIGDADTLAGRLYVLSSLSEDPDIKNITDLHKIGFTTGSVEKRIQGAEHSPTYLNAPVRIEAVYDLYNVRPSTVENIIHKVFAPYRLNITLTEPAHMAEPGAEPKTVHITEWFVAPLEEIDRVINELT